jgi:2-oxoacid:acceptor oxidoreductase delta subunit (pyruvate/2-ketoisovalerate family)
MKMKSWTEIPIGGVIVDAGNAIEYKTGGWRAFRPILTMDKCTRCLICWLYCPEVAMLTEEGKFLGISLDHCKGCGICAKVCPPKCIEMVEEGKLEAVG